VRLKCRGKTLTSGHPATQNKPNLFWLFGGVMRKPEIVFFGSGPVAAESLRLLLEHQQVEAVITKPTTLHEMSAIAGDIPVHTVTNRKELDELIAEKKFHSKMGVLIDFGIIVSRKVIDYFPLGIINSHFSILPDLRGADPITFAILSGQKMTGVSLMFLVEAMDEGPLHGYGEQPLDGKETTPLLTHQLILLSNALLKHELPNIFEKGFKGVPQDVTKRKISYSRKLTKEDGILDWKKPAEVLEREVRAFIEWPKSSTQLAGKNVTVTASHVLEATDTPGTVKVQGKEIVIYCSKDALVIDKLKPAGKNEMTAEAFLAGHKHLL
jgi:methionyl-tRNA formyltransferase